MLFFYIRQCYIQDHWFACLLPNTSAINSYNLSLEIYVLLVTSCKHWSGSYFCYVGTFFFCFGCHLPGAFFLVLQPSVLYNFNLEVYVLLVTSKLLNSKCKVTKFWLQSFSNDVESWTLWKILNIQFESFLYPVSKIYRHLLKSFWIVHIY